MLKRKNLTLFTFANVVIIYLVSIAPVISTSNYGVETNDDEFPAKGCDCGPHSQGCVFQNDTKVCKCDISYRQEGETCTAYCQDNFDCYNGATCVNESCQCLPGTRGDFCTTIEACEGGKGPLMCGDPMDVFCDYDRKAHKAYCHCSILDYIYFPPNRTCIECDCGDFGSCTLVNGKKTCKCKDGSAVRLVPFFGDIVERCIACGCGNNSDGCSFQGLDKKICNCKNGTAQQPDFYGEACNECSCGPHGQCYFKGWYQFCNCDQGYKPFLNLNRTELTCKACDCGKNGECSFEEEIQQCKCNPGYAVRNGKCAACQCYADDKPVDCTFNDEIQSCLCPDGYETGKFVCKDIDECANGNNTCPPTTDCVNTMGSYDCKCKEGYAPYYYRGYPKTSGCEDIDECMDPTQCPPNNTFCNNLPGSYECYCRAGYVPVHPNLSPKVAGCEKETQKTENKGNQTGIIILSILIGVCAVAIISVVLNRRYGRRSRDIPFQTIKG